MNQNQYFHTENQINQNDFLPSFSIQKSCEFKLHIGISQLNAYIFEIHRDWSPKFATGLNIMIGIVQKV